MGFVPLAIALHCRYGSGMKLLFLHGSPATGKLTVAKALLGIVPGRLFDNHAGIDLPALRAKSVAGLPPAIHKLGRVN